MHIIYHCPHPSYAAVVAAAIHLGLLPPDQKPPPRSLLEIVDHFAWNRAERGRIYPAGLDEGGNSIYFLPRGFNLTILQNVVAGFSAILGVDKGELSLVDAELAAGRHWRRGALFVCSLGRIAGSRFFPLLEIERNYFALVRLVEEQRGRGQLLGKGK